MLHANFETDTAKQETHLERLPVYIRFRGVKTRLNIEYWLPEMLKIERGYTKITTLALVACKKKEMFCDIDL